MEPEDTINITKQEYYALKCSQLKLDLLSCAGVDNWDWYGDALNPDEGESFSQQCDTIHAEIFKPESEKP